MDARPAEEVFESKIIASGEFIIEVDIVEELGRSSCSSASRADGRCGYVLASSDERRVVDGARARRTTSS